MKHLLLLTMLITHICIPFALAGLGNAQQFDDVIAIYHFEDETDSGPRNFDVLLEDGTSIANNGKIGKCLQMQNQSKVLTLGSAFLAVTRGASITTWVKLEKQTEEFGITVVGINDDNSLVGGFSMRILSDGNVNGEFYNFVRERITSVTSTDIHVSNNKWHHIAVTQYSNIIRIFVNAELVKKGRVQKLTSFVSDQTFFSIGVKDDTAIKGSILLDELGFFERGFSIYEIEALYEVGLENFLDAMSVDPQEKASTTWGHIKSSLVE